MEYNYNIIDDVYYWMLSGKKTIEVRILKDKSRQINVGDIIIFNNQDQMGRYIKVKVIKKVIYDSIDLLIKDNPVDKMMPNHSEKELKDLLNKIYGDTLNVSKIVAFTFKYIASDIDDIKN